ncbi:protein SLX4IP isoform X1 [Thunnus maccoyii]|uniref:protein SLX4IP isoform X1 n=1 Tax=Thunnus maccoyii TaxID=8240 RepID=UPI001C4B2E2D|nr:protein SLX4IP isoform X1 [Thunnus maccoyii]XP_042288998.1 protein SLX4IP isoform X1 [Thunnus maccoyii]XP_042288999.1 protein SLX4IP isoform X1 [Thunnus maccoyii]
MAPLKFVIKCGNFAVLVDLHVLPLGGQEDTSWFTTNHIEDVTTLVRDSVDQRVKQYTESLHNRRQPKQKKELAPASAFVVKGKNFNLVANFLKRHSSLRCIVKQLYGDLRVFPERYVVCVSCPEDASAHHGNPSLAATELSEQSRSEYFSRVGETQEPLNSPTKTKKTVLQKIAKQAGVQRELYGSSLGEQQIDQRAFPKDQRGEHRAGESESSPKETVSSSGQKFLPEAEHQVPCSSASEAVAQIGTTRKQGLTQQQQAENCLPDSISPNGASVVFCQHEISQETSKSKRYKPSDAGEDPHPQRSKRTCLGSPPATMQTHSTECSTQTSKHDLLLLPPLPPVEAKAESKAFPVSECKKTTLEVELLTPGKRAQRLPLTSNNTAQTNQNRLAASLRGLSVKPASSGSSISSRSTLGEEGSENVPRTSRLRRLKRS